MIKKVILMVLVVISLIAAFETVTASISNLNINDCNNLTFTSFDQQNGLYKSLKGESPYFMGSPVLTDIWVDPVNGNDANSGNTASQSLKTIQEAWTRIPSKIQLTQTGYRIMLKPGVYKQDDMPSNSWMESRYGTYQCPIIIQSAESSKKVEIQLLDIMNIYECRYLYLIGISVQSGANNVLHLEKCDHILIKQIKIMGTGNINDCSCPQEDLKANQCRYIYLENCNISNAWNVPVDFVGVQEGHILNNRIHEAGDWCMYLKGGSAHFKIEGNELYNSGNGGFTAGQGTGFEYMVSPYIHYETYDIKFINNIIHDTNGAGMGVHGGYNILLAYNTLYKVGRSSHVLEFMHGIRSCDGNTAKCHDYLKAGGWGTAQSGEEERIPNKNVYVYNNIIYNPDGYQSQWSHFLIENPVKPSSGTNIPSPSKTDDNLKIVGNIIWNGPSNLPLGIEDVTTTLKTQQLHDQNYINTLKPQLIDPDHGNFKAKSGGNIFSVKKYTMPDFDGGDLPASPRIPQKNFDLINSIYMGFPGIFSL